MLTCGTSFPPSLPLSFKTLEQLILPYGTIVSTRILRDGAGNSRGVGFARMASKEHCEKVIELLNGATLPGTADSLMVKFADCGSSKKKSKCVCVSLCVVLMWPNDL